MKTGFELWIGLLMIAGLLALITTPYSYAGADQKNPGDIVMKACSACHDTGKVCNGLGKKNSEAWLKTIDRMVKKGAAVDKTDIPLVVDYLAGLAPGSKPVCK